MAAVRMGRKRDNDGLSVHLEISGETCNVLRPVNVEARTTHDPAERCKSCWTPKRIAAARELIDAAKKFNAERAFGPVRVRVEDALIALGQLFRTPAEVARDNELMARLNAPHRPLSAWGAMRQNNLRTLPQQAEHAAYVNKAA